MTATTALYSITEIRAMEQAAKAALPPATLMRRAGQAAATAALALSKTAAPHAKVLVLAGPGDNGGDALEAASHLAQLDVVILLCADPVRQSTDAQQALAHAQKTPAQFVDSTFLPAIAQTSWALVIDGLFGIGLTRPIAGELAELVEAVNRLTCPVLALDVPSGLNADTGQVVGPDGSAIHASHTLTFIADKPGLHTGSGRDYAGCVQVAALEVDARYRLASKACLNGPSQFSAALRKRQHNSHKGRYGDVMVIGGAHGMAGAPILAARAALMCGAGRVSAAFVAEAPAYDSAQPELMCRLAADCDLGSAVLVVGPGLGQSTTAQALLTQALVGAMPLVLDADALNLIAAEPALQQTLAQRAGQTMLTPHPLEAARLLHTSAAQIQADRLAAARTLAQRFNAIVILKGSGSIIADSDGQIAINPTGNPALASAGTGDVLAGICGALLAQGWPAREAALAAVWLHGSAADTLVEQDCGPIGLTASELLPMVRRALNQLVAADDAGHPHRPLHSLP